MARGIYRKATRTGGKGLGKFLGALELAVMELAWKRSGLTVKEAHEVLTRSRSLAYTTVMTVMCRLAQKGLLLREKHGRAYTYRAAHRREELRGLLAAEVSGALLADFGDVAVVQFVNQLDRVDPELMARLRQLTRADDDE